MIPRLLTDTSSSTAQLLERLLSSVRHYDAQDVLVQVLRQIISVGRVITAPAGRPALLFSHLSIRM